MDTPQHGLLKLIFTLLIASLLGGIIYLYYLQIGNENMTAISDVVKTINTTETTEILNTPQTDEFQALEANGNLPIDTKTAGRLDPFAATADVSAELVVTTPPPVKP